MNTTALPRGTAELRSARPATTWFALAAAAVLLAAAWVRSPGALPLAGLLPVALWLTVIAIRFRERAWRRRLLFSAALLGFVANATHHGLVARRLAADGEAVRAERERRAGQALQGAVRSAGEDLLRIAQAAVGASTGDRGRSALFDQLGDLVAADDDRAVIVADSGRAIAWAGKLLAPVDSLPGPTGAVATTFHVIGYAVATAGSRSAVASVLLHAERPAERLSRPLDARVARDHGVTGFAYGGSGSAERVPGAVELSLGDEPLLAARALVAPVEVLAHDARASARVRGGLALLGMVLMLLAVAWRRDVRRGGRLAALAVAVAALALVPLSSYSAVPLFDPTMFLVRAGGRFTANAGALALSSGLVLLTLLSALRQGAVPRSRTQALVGVLAVAMVGPFVLRELARGIAVPATGAGVGLWLSWEVTLYVAAVTVLLAGVTAGRAALAGTRAGLPAWVAPLIAAAAALSAPLLLDAPGRLPALHPVLWVLAIGALAFTRRARVVVLSVAFVAASGAVTLTWYAVVRASVQLAARDVRGLTQADPTATALLARFAEALDPTTASRSRVDLLSGFARTELAAAGFPTEIATWAPDGSRMAELRVGRGSAPTPGVNLLAIEARLGRARILREDASAIATSVVLAEPHLDGTVTTVVVAPQSALVPTDAFGAFLGFPPPPSPEPPYLLRAGEVAGVAGAPGPAQGLWWREGNALHGDWFLPAAGGLWQRIHATVELRTFDALLSRGALLVLVDLAVVGAIWFLIVAADGALARWWRLRRRHLLHSFRVRLSVALFAAFAVPSALLGAWSFQRLQADDRQSRDLLVRETLRGVAASTDSVLLAEAAERFDTPLFLYADGLLVGTSDPLLDALAPLGRLLPPQIARSLADGEDPVVGQPAELGASPVRLGYRVETDVQGVDYVLAAPARLDDRLLDRRRNDLVFFLLFGLTLGGVAALAASGAGSRQLSRPIRALQERALALARGAAPTPLGEDPPVEFAPVFDAFGTMTTDLAESRAALETAERRLAATLRNVASGVVAADDAGRITFANPRAEAILGGALPAGASLAPVLGTDLRGPLERFLGSPDEDAEFEVEREGRRLQVRAARLAPGARRVVVTVDDVTDVARAERVLAWGEMARQVAHEIKNPLTPIRLGMQHLQRAHRDQRVDFDRVLAENTRRVLAEIDRLDEIARAFSRYGAAPVADEPAVAVDVAQVARDVLDLERMGADQLQWVDAIAPGEVPAAARARELREVLLNLLENARQAHARTVTLRVEAVPGGGALVEVLDDGDGIPPALRARIFEPHFSTRTSGSGLGLAISRRLVERWGGTLDAAPAGERGTVLAIRLAPAPAPDVSSGADA